MLAALSTSEIKTYLTFTKSNKKLEKEVSDMCFGESKKRLDKSELSNH